MGAALWVVSSCDRDPSAGTCLLTISDAKLVFMPCFQTCQLKEAESRFGVVPMQT